MKFIKTSSPALWLSGLILSVMLASSLQITLLAAEIKSPSVDLILQRLEDRQHQDPTQSLPYEVTREYKVFHGDAKHPTSEVIAKINFVPPNMKTYKIIKARGNSLGEKIIRELLSRETDTTRREHSTEINRVNYDFVFLGQQNFGAIPEYVFEIYPKRKDKYLLRGQIWVNTSSFRIRRIEGAPAKSPSFWLKNLRITMQYGELGSMWVPVAYTGIATVRIFGEYTLAGLNTRSSKTISAAPR